MIILKANPTIVTYSRTLQLAPPPFATLSLPFTKTTGKEIVKTQTAWNIHATKNQPKLVLISSNLESPFLSCALHARKRRSHDRETRNMNVHATFRELEKKVLFSNWPSMAE